MNIATINSWIWIALIFGMQTVAAVLFSKSIVLDLREIVLPLAWIALGAATALCFSRWRRFARLGPWKWWVPAVLYALFIFSMSSKNFPAEEPPVWDLDLLHPFIYATLGFFIRYAYHYSSFRNREMRHLLRVMIIGLIYGALDELHQSFIAGRTASLGDFLMDGVGLILGLGAFWLCHGSLHLFQKETPP